MSHIKVQIEFDDGSVLPVGSFRWPFDVRYVRYVTTVCDSGLIEVFDAKGVAVVNADDLTLEDLCG